jgi:hypothetical protein
MPLFSQETLSNIWGLFREGIKIGGSAMALALVLVSITQSGSDPERIAMFHTVEAMNEIAGDDLDKSIQ